MSATKAAKAAKPTGPKYQVSALRAQSLEHLGIEPSTFDGVFYGCADDDLFTREEAQARVDAWLKRPLKIGRNRR